MVRIVSGIDGNSGNFCVTISSPLVEKYYTNLCGMMKNDKMSPSGLTIDKVASDSVLIQFPPKGGVNPIIGELEGGKAKVDASAAEPLNNVLDIARKFVMSAIKHCTKSIEFIPLFDFTGDIRNYSFEEMKTDIIEAVKNKRNLCIIDKFQAYLDNQKDQKYEFNQYLIDFNSNPSEYSDFVLMVQNNNLSELRKIYKTKLKRTSWF